MFSTRIRTLIQQQWAGLIALFLVLTGGSAWALDGSNTVFSDDIVDRQVKEADVGQGAVASNEVKNDSIAAGDIAPNSLTSPRIADGTLTGADVADNSLKGVDIDESTLSSIGGGGLQVRKINFQVPYGTGQTPVLSLAGLGVIAECQDFGDVLDVKAVTSKDSSSVLYFAGGAGDADDTNAVRDIHSAAFEEFNVGDVMNIDDFTPHFPDTGNDALGTLQYWNPDGSVVVVHLAFDEFTPAAGCALTGIATGG